jgi:hypothetical protein
MSLDIIQTLRSKPSFEAARLIGLAPQFIKNDNLVNLLNQYDYNQNKKDKNAMMNEQRLIQQINLFSSIPGLKEDINKWLSS